MEASPNRSILQLSTCTRQRHSGRRQIWPSLSFEIPKFQCLSVKAQPLVSLSVCLPFCFFYIFEYKKKVFSPKTLVFRQTSRHFCMVLGLWSVPGKGWASGLQEVLPVGRKVKGDSLVFNYLSLQVVCFGSWFFVTFFFLALILSPYTPFFLFCFYFVLF